MYFEVACRLVTVVTFAVSVGAKVRGPGAFASFVTAIQTLPHPRYPSPRLLGGAVVGGESLIVVLVLMPWTSEAGLLLSALTLLTYLALTALVLRRHMAVACNCFGVSGQPIGVPSLVRNAGLFIVAVIGLALAVDTANPPPGTRLLGTATAAYGAVVIATIAVYGDDLVWIATKSVRR